MTQTEFLEMKNCMSEMKITLDGNNGRLVTAEEKIGEFEDGAIETIQIETQRESMIENNEKLIRELWKNVKGNSKSNIHKLKSLKAKHGKGRQKKYLK